MYYILHGSQELPRSESIAQLKAQVSAGGLGDLNVVTLDGRQLRPTELADACNALPFFGERRLVLVHDMLQRLEPRAQHAEEAGDGDDAPDAALAQQVLQVLAALPPSARLVFVERRALSKRNPILRQAQHDAPEKAYIRLYDTPDDLPGWVAERARGKGVTIDGAAANLLVRHAGSDLRRLDLELDKLAAHANYARAITVEDVLLLVPPATEVDIFRFVDALGSRNVAGAMRELERLFADGRHPLYVLAMVARQFRLLIGAKELLTEGAPSSEIMRALNLKRSFQLEKLAQQARRFDLDALEEIHQRVIDTDAAIKTGRIGERLALEVFVMEGCRRRPEAGYQPSSRSRTR